MLIVRGVGAVVVVVLAGLAGTPEAVVIISCTYPPKAPVGQISIFVEIFVLERGYALLLYLYSAESTKN